MVFRNLQTSVDYSTLGAAVAALPDPLDQSYTLEDQDQATYIEAVVAVTLDTAGFVLTIQGRPGLPPTFSPLTGGKGATYAGLQIEDPALMVHVRDLIITDGFIDILSNGPTARSYVVERCSILTTGPNCISVVDAGPGSGGDPGFWMKNCVLGAKTGQTVWLEGDSNSRVEHCTISSFYAAPPDGADCCVLWDAAAGSPQAQFRNCLFRYSDNGGGTAGVFKVNNLGESTLTGDGNMFHLRTGSEPYAWNTDTASAIANLAAWRVATGADALSVEEVGALPDASMYADEAARDLSLALGAAAIGAVVPAFEGLVAVDVGNLARPAGASSDVGAHEFPESLPPSVGPIHSATMPDSGWGADPAGALAHGSVEASSVLTGVPVVSDWCALGAGWLLSQFRFQPKLLAVLCAILRQGQALEQSIADLRDLRSLHTARGQALDTLGYRLGFPRNALPDPTASDDWYRRLLFGVAAAKSATSGPDDLIRVALVLLGGAGGVTYREIYPATLSITASSAQTYDDGRAMARVVRKAKPASVAFSFRYMPKPSPLGILVYDDDPILPALAIPEAGAIGPLLPEADAGV